MKAYAIFEGGGAKGYAHIGAVQAAEERGFHFVGLAGTSVGALIAALLAAGYSGKELFEVAPDGTCSGVLAVDPLNHLNQADWAKFQAFKKWRPFDEVGPKFSPMKARPRLSNQTALGRTLYRPFVRLRRPLVYFAGLARYWVKIHIIFFANFGLARAVMANLGLTSTAGFRAFLDLALRDKLNVPPGEPIRFRHLPTPLRIIASDLVSEDLKIFGVNADDLVVKFVIASASFPLFFRPFRFSGGLLVDGGLLSNNPAWVFDAERSCGTESIPTLGFVLIDPPLSAVAPKDTVPSSLQGFVAKLVRTSLYGRQLETREISEYYSVPLRPKVETLDLEEAFRKAPELISVGRADAEAELTRQMGLREPLDMKAVLIAVGGTIYGALRPFSRSLGEIDCSMILRVDAQLARVAYNSYTPAFDTSISIPMMSLGPAICFGTTEPVLIAAAEATRRPGLMDRVEAGLRPGGALDYPLPIFPLRL